MKCTTYNCSREATRYYVVDHTTPDGYCDLCFDTGKAGIKTMFHFEELETREECERLTDVWKVMSS